MSFTVKGTAMKSRFASVGVATVLTAGLLLAPGLSPAQASSGAALSSASAITAAKSTSKFAPGTVATTYGMWFIPCDVFGLRLC